MVQNIVAWGCCGAFAAVAIAYGIWYFRSGKETDDNKDTEKNKKEENKDHE